MEANLIYLLSFKVYYYSHRLLTKEEANETLFSRSQIVTLKEEITDSEGNKESRSQNATLKITRGENIKYLPYAFTENGIAMLSSVLKSSTAIQVNIHIMRAKVNDSLTN